MEFRNLHVGDAVAVGRKEDGSQGIFVWPDGFDENKEGNGDIFAFRQRRSRETAFSKDYDELCELLKYEKKHGHIVWVMGPACAFDASSRRAFEKLVNNGYVHGLLAGNALATHDLEAAWLKTALGQNIYTQQSVPLGHYNHLDTLNAVRSCGSIPAFIEKVFLLCMSLSNIEKSGIDITTGFSVTTFFVAVVLFVLSLIFSYGVSLQKQADETL